MVMSVLWEIVSDLALLIGFFLFWCLPVFFYYAYNIGIPFVVDGNAPENQSFAEASMFLSIEND
mgnify:CR=1 FL=1|jgi:hypothetical protein